VLTTASAFQASRFARASQLARLQARADQAIELGRRATESDPLRAQYWDTLGLAYVSGARLKEAASAFEEATRLAPYDIRYSGDLARAYVVLIQRGDREAAGRARDVAERAVLIDPNNPQAHLTRAIVMQVTSNLPEANRSIDRALALDPQSSNPNLYVTAARIKTESGRPGETVAIARRGLAILGAIRGSIELRAELTRALLAVNQPAEALREVEVALSIAPNDPSLERLRSQVRAALGQ
jgi:tetratricopeptide (TPR) repeat protein